MKSLRRVVALVPLLLAAACASPAPSARAPISQQPIRYAAWEESDYRYRIGSGDELALRFLINPDLNGSVIVGPDGRGVFPLVGPVKVAGMTVLQADSVLSGAYGQVLRNPQVEALVTSYGSAQIYVGGEVKEAGVKPIKGQISVVQAVMLAGGFADDAHTGKVAVLRQAPGEPAPHLRVVNVRGELNSGEAGGDFLLRPGDVVFVPRSAIGEVDLFVKQYVTNLIPFNISYGYAASGRF